MYYFKSKLESYLCNFWPTVNEMQQFELLVASNKAALQYNNLFKNILQFYNWVI